MNKKNVYILQCEDKGNRWRMRIVISVNLSLMVKLNQWPFIRICSCRAQGGKGRGAGGMLIAHNANIKWEKNEIITNDECIFWPCRLCNCKQSSENLPMAEYPSILYLQAQTQIMYNITHLIPYRSSCSYYPIWYPILPFYPKRPIEKVINGRIQYITD